MSVVLAFSLQMDFFAGSERVKEPKNEFLLELFEDDVLAHALLFKLFKRNRNYK